MGKYYIQEKSERTRFVQNNWLEIGPYAYAAYMQAGRGAVVVSADNLRDDAAPAFRYFLQAEIEKGVTNQGIPAEWAQYVREYAPEREAVVCFDIPGFAVTAGRYEIINARPKDMWLARTLPPLQAKGEM